jgi:hypothetical protein
MLEYKLNPLDKGRAGVKWRSLLTSSENIGFFKKVYSVELVPWLHTVLAIDLVLRPLPLTDDR